MGVIFEIRSRILIWVNCVGLEFLHLVLLVEVGEMRWLLFLLLYSLKKLQVKRNRLRI